jgi:hypothetical protein
VARRRSGRAGAGLLTTVIAMAAVLGGCATARRIDHGVYHSPHGYRVTLPGPEWRLVEDSAADLELRNGDRTGMLVTAECGESPSRVPDSMLLRRVLFGLRGRRVLERGDVVVNGAGGARAVVEGTAEDRGDRLRVEAYVLRHGACVYDFLYAAPPDAFEQWRPAFGRLVESFATE